MQYLLLDTVDENPLIKGDHIMLAMGDSLTAEGAYIARLLEIIGVYWTIVNKGVGGHATSSMVSRFATDVTDNEDADYVIIWGGINDVNSGVTAATTKDNLQTMYDAAHSAGIKVIALTISPDKGSSAWTIERQAIREEINTFIKQEAENVDYIVDVYSALEDPENLAALLPAYDGGDHGHLSEEGYTLVGTLIGNLFIQSVIARGDQQIQTDPEIPSSDNYAEDESLEAFYPLTANGNDATAHARHLTNVGSVAFDSTGATFNGSTKKLIAASAAWADKSNSQPFTVGAWIKPSASPSFAHVIANRQVSPLNWILYQEGTHFGFHGAAQHDSAFPITIDQEYLVIAVHDGAGTVKLYIDGELVDTLTGMNLSSGGSSYAIGGNGTTQDWAGKVHHNFFFSRALSEEDAANIAELGPGAFSF